MPSALPSGTFLGPYEIQAPLGAGGMGDVYKARDTRLDRTVAIKILAANADDAVTVRERFEREARAISQLNHPHVCTLYDIGEQPAATPSDPPVRYLVMEFLEGETLAARLERGFLPIEQAVTWAIQIADALDKVHRKGIVHGDLKPGNIMLTKAGVKLLDFGLARQQRAVPSSDWPDAATRTVPIATGSVLGTLQYLAPEQLEGTESDARSDIFACGAVIYEMVSGRKAFGGNTPAAVMAAIMTQHPPRLSSLQSEASPALEHVVSTCLAKDPDDRWQHAGDLARELQWVASAAAGGAPPPRRSTRTLVWMAAAAAVLLAAGALATYGYLARRGSDAVRVSRTSVLLPEGLRFPGAGELGGIERFAISPDGRQIAFVATDPNGNQMLWLRPLESLAARPLQGTDGALSPFWSPDSSRLGFVARGQLKTITPTPGGGPPVVVASPASNTSGAWNSDNIILFTPTAGSALHRVSAGGGTPEPVTALARERAEILHRNPFFLPDGRHFLFVAVSAPEGETTGARGLYVGSLDSDDVTQVFASGSIAKYADGRLLFVRDNRLMAQPFDADTLALSGEPRAVAEQVELIGPSSGAFSVSAAGVLAYQRAAGPGSQLVWFDRAGRQQSAVGEPGRYGDLELSPDGTRAIVSVLDTATNTRDLWVFDERGVRTKLTFDRGDEVAPIWSPDGTRVVFASNRNGHFDLYQKAASGIGDERLVHADNAEKYPAGWLTKQDVVLYTSFGQEGAGLSLVSIDGEESPRRVLDVPSTQARLSPDGRWLAYTSAASGQPEVYLVPYPEASTRWQVSSAGGSYPRWTASGREILFAGRDNRLMSVTVAADGQGGTVGAPQPLFDLRPVTPRSFFAPAPDGQRVLVNVQQTDSRSSSITVVQNWSAALAP